MSQTETAFKSPQELMSIRVGTGRIWTPGRGNTSIPFFAPNYWKQPDVNPLIDPNPYYEAVNAPAAAVAAPAPVMHNRAVPSSSPVYRRVAMGVLFGAALAVAVSIGMAWHKHAEPHAMPAPLHVSHWRG